MAEISSKFDRKWSHVSDICFHVEQFVTLHSGIKYVRFLQQCFENLFLSQVFYSYPWVSKQTLLWMGFKSNHIAKRTPKKIIPLLFPKMNMIERKHLHHVSDNNNVVSNEKGNIHTTTLPLYICNSVGREARPLKKKRNTRHFRAKKV